MEFKYNYENYLEEGCNFNKDVWIIYPVNFSAISSLLGGTRQILNSARV